jgi:hypothetical protein
MFASVLPLGRLLSASVFGAYRRYGAGLCVCGRSRL